MAKSPEHIRLRSVFVPSRIEGRSGNAITVFPAGGAFIPRLKAKVFSRRGIKIGFTTCLILFFSPSFLVFGGDFVNSAQGGSVDEISSELEASYPSIAHESAINIAEAVYLIKQLEREIFLTNQMLDLREEDKAESVLEETHPSGTPEKGPFPEKTQSAEINPDAETEYVSSEASVAGAEEARPPVPGESEAPKKSFRTPKEEIFFLLKSFNDEIALTKEVLEPGAAKAARPMLGMLPPEGETGEAGRVRNIDISIQPPEINTDMVLAKQVSEEPAKTLPREELGEEPPLAGRPEQFPLKAGKVGAGKAYEYSESDLESKNYSITIEKDQPILISIPGLRRFLVTDPNVIDVLRLDGGQLAVKAVNLGESFLHLWVQEARKTLRVKVIQKGADIFQEIKQRLREAEKMESFKFRYSFDRYRLNSKSDNASRSYHYTDWVHRWGAFGETPWGMLDAKFQYQGKGYREDDFNSDLSAWNTSLIGPDIEASVGDVGAYFSEITLPPTAYQGFRFKNPDAKNINYDLMWGARGAPMWGKKIVDFEGKNYFYGGKFGVKPADFINLRTIVMRSQGNDHETSEVVAGAGGGLKFFDGAVKFDGEYARGQHGDAFRIESNLKSDECKMEFNSIYRDIDSNYELVLDQSAPHRGEKGYYLKLRYDPLKFLRYTGEYNRYRDRYQPNIERPKHSNYETNSVFYVDLTDRTTLTWSIYDGNKTGTNAPSKTHSQSVGLQHNFDFLKNNISMFALYQPGTYKNTSATDSNYTERRFTAGMRMNVLKNIYLDIAELWHYRKMLANRDSGTSSSMNMGASYSSQIFNTPFYTSLSWRYKRDSNIMSAIQVLPNEKYMEWESELKYKPSSEMELYLRVSKKNIKPILDSAPTNKRDEMRIYGGGSYLFDTTLRFSNAGLVQGYVFKDLNNNGVKDEGEEGMPRVGLFAGTNKSAVTNEKGFFKFDKLKGEEASILLDIKTLPEKYLPTTSNPQRVKLEREKITEVNFGVLTNTEISGRVFNDLNMDGELNGEDGGVQDVRITLDDGAVEYTARGGYYTFEYVKSGDRTISMDPASMPLNLLPLSFTKSTIKAEEGKIYKQDFPLYALRTVVGAVFVDKDGNGRLDSGDEGVADVEVKIGDNSTLTDGMGRYFLKKLKSGPQRVEVAAESVPKEYELAAGAFRDVTLAPEGDIKEGVDFPLKKKR